MQFVIEDSIFDMFPGTKVAVIVAQGVNNSGSNSEIIDFLREQEASLPERFGETPPAEHVHIAPWREAYRVFGSKPSKYRSSIENLLRRSLKGNPLPEISPLVDLYNAISLKYMLPAGGEDLDQMQGDLRLCHAGPDELAVTILGEDEDQAPDEGEVIYKDDVGTICRRWNWREADRTKLTESTTNAVLVLEALPGIEGLEAAADELAAAVEKHLGGTCSTQILSSELSSVGLL